MTALHQYERLESSGLWRGDINSQRRDVTVSFGKATLVISDAAGRALTHWSLPAVVRQNAGVRPAVFTPDTGPDETLEIDDDLMIDAIEQVRKTLGADAKGRVVVLPVLAQGAVAMTGQLIALDRRIIENADDPAVPAGYILAAHLMGQRSDPFANVLDAVGFRKTLGLLATGDLASENLADYARSLTEQDAAFPTDRILIDAFAAAQLPTTPFAFARDGTGARTAGLIAADAHAERDEPEILSDADWIRLQGICN